LIKTLTVLMLITATVGSLCGCMAPPGQHYETGSFTPAPNDMAPPGWHYETGSFTPAPNDPCSWFQAGSPKAPGIIRTINTGVGTSHGPPHHVVAVENSSGTSIIDATSGRFFDNSNAFVSEEHLTCHMTLVFDQGLRQSGVLSVVDPGGTKPLRMEWLPDTIYATEMQRRRNAAVTACKGKGYWDVRAGQCNTSAPSAKAASCQWVFGKRVDCSDSRWQQAAREISITCSGTHGPYAGMAMALAPSTYLACQQVAANQLIMSVQLSGVRLH
jgi:hypothetical protein